MKKNKDWPTPEKDPRQKTLFDKKALAVQPLACWPKRFYMEVIGEKRAGNEYPG